MDTAEEIELKAVEASPISTVFAPEDVAAGVDLKADATGNEAPAASGASGASAKARDDVEARDSAVEPAQTARASSNGAENAASAKAQEAQETEPRGDAAQAAQAAAPANADGSGSGAPIFTNVRPMVEPTWKVFFRQLRVILRNDFTLAVLRWYKSTLLQVIVPFFFVLFLYALQRGATNSDASDVPYPTPYTLGGVPACTVSGRGKPTPCISIMYAPANDPTATAIMNTFITKNNARTGLNFVMEPEISNLNVVLTSSQSVVPVPDSTFIYDFVLQRPNTTMFGIAFSRDANNYQYQIWYNSTITANTTQTVSDSYGVIVTALMRGIDEAILTVASGSDQVLDVSLEDWPSVAVSGRTDLIITNSGSAFFFASAMVNFLTILTTIVGEKEQHLRHAMQMMGLFPSVYWIGWFTVNMVIVFLSSMVTVVFGYVFQFPAFINTNFAVLLLLFFMFSLAMIFVAFFITTLVRRVRSAVSIGTLVLIIGLVFMFVIFSGPVAGYIWWEDSTSPAGWIVLMFLPPFNFGTLYLMIATLSAGSYDFATDSIVPGPGFPWSQLFEPIPAASVPTFGTFTFPLPVQALYFLLWNMAFYALLTWYFDNVLPDEFGQRRPLYFFVLPSYWGCAPLRRHKAVAVAVPPREADEDSDVYAARCRALDPARADEQAIRLTELRKVFNDGWLDSAKKRKIAVSNSSWGLERGKLLALLGQNGAGKTTTINMLCGFTPASSGDAYLYGRSIRHEMDIIRPTMGVCPQFDILFPDLTAREHIELFCGIKNIPGDMVQTLIHERLQAVRLWKVKDQRAASYSGGMRRRLSVAISTIGDPDVVFMDEPTTGMDPLNRRYVWAFVEQFKKGRVIVLTTHSMEEADILGDEIAIMAVSKVSAVGTPIHLKNKFGAGYRLSVVCDDANAQAVKDDLVGRVPGLKVEDDSAGALMFTIPKGSMGEVPALIRYLESHANASVKEWGVSQTTLEDVFLLLIRAVNPAKAKGMARSSIAPGPRTSDVPQPK